MYAVTGITGQVGRTVALTLLAAGHDVRAVLRDEAKAEPWLARGCEVAIAAMDDAAALTNAFTGAQGVFILLPPIFDPAPGFPEMSTILANLDHALRAAQPSRIVCLSTIGAQATQSNLLAQLGMAERAFSALPMPVTFLRAAWFMENAAWDVAAARDGRIGSYLQPLDRPVPMVSVADVGAHAATLLQQDWQGSRIVELEGPSRVAPNDIAATFADILGRAVQAGGVPRDQWREMFLQQGMRNPEPRMAMLDGFNAGWICFEGETTRGRTTLREALAKLVLAAD